MKPFNKGQKNGYNDAEAIAEAALRPNLRTVSDKSQDQLDLQALHRVRSRLVSRRTATINQIRAFLIEQGITIRKGLRAVQNSLLALLDERREEISPRMRHIILDLHDDWMRLDARIEAISEEIGEIGQSEAHCRALRTIPGVGPVISTALVAAVGQGEAFDHGREMAAWGRVGAPTIQHRWAHDAWQDIETRQQVFANTPHPGCQDHPDATEKLAKSQLRGMVGRG